MKGLIGFSILTSVSWWLILLLILLLAAFSLFIYKYTIPRVTSGLRSVLIILRSLIFALILFLIFEPVLSLIHKDSSETKTFVYIDNSISISTSDSLKKLDKALTFISDLNSAGGIKTRFYTFGRKIDSLEETEKNKINFSETLTNFSSVVDHIKRNNSKINSAVILSDGIITEGIDPTYQAEKLQVPIFTVGIGDSSRKKDIQIYNVLHNQVIYTGKPTTIEVSVKNFGFGNGSSRVSFFEENKFIESKDLALSETGLNKILFNYKPEEGGEKKLSFSVAPLEGESSAKNNTRTVYVNVLDTKLIVCIIAGSPSSDVSAISNALSADKNIQLRKLIQISSGKFWNDINPAVIDSADLLFLIDFPSAGTSQNIIERVSAAAAKNKPFFFLLSSGVNIGRMNAIEKNLPFSISKSTNEFIQVLPDLSGDSFSTYFSTSNNKNEIWNNLPQVTQFSTELAAKPGSNILVKSKVRNISIGNPLIVSRSLGNQRVFAILAGDIWRWQLQTAERNPDFFDNFINDIVKWLSVSARQKQFTITTDRKIYFPGDEVEFTAELYDRTFNPIDTAGISLRISYNSKTIDQTFYPAGGGIYTSRFIPNEAGDYTFEGAASLNGSQLKSGPGRFSAGEIQIEKLDTRMRTEFLELLSASTSGEYYQAESYNGLKEKLEKLNRSSSKESVSKSEFQLWANKWILIIIICLFAAEWFIRKRAGMI